MAPSPCPMFLSDIKAPCLATQQSSPGQQFIRYKRCCALRTNVIANIRKHRDVCIGTLLHRGSCSLGSGNALAPRLHARSSVIAAFQGGPDNQDPSSERARLVARGSTPSSGPAGGEDGSSPKLPPLPQQPDGQAGGRAAAAVRGDGSPAVMGHDDESPYSDQRSLDREIMSIALPMLATLAADPIAGLVDSAYMGRAGSSQLAAVGVALSVFNTATKLFNVPLLAVTTSSVALATGKAIAVVGGAAEAPAGKPSPAAAVSTSATSGPVATAGTTVGAEGSEVELAQLRLQRASSQGPSCSGQVSSLPPPVSAAAEAAAAAAAEQWGGEPGGGACASPTDARSPATLESYGSSRTPLDTGSAAKDSIPQTDLIDLKPEATGCADATPASAASGPVAAAASSAGSAPPAVSLAATLQARAAASCLLLAALVGLVQAVALLGAGPWLVELWGVPSGSPVHTPALAFLWIRAVGAPVTIVMLALQGVYRGLQDTRTPFRATLYATVINIILAPLFIFVAHLGAAGAAIATVVAQAIPLGVMTRELGRRLPALWGGAQATTAAAAAAPRPARVSGNGAQDPAGAGVVSSSTDAVGSDCKVSGSSLAGGSGAAACLGAEAGETAALLGSRATPGSVPAGCEVAAGAPGTAVDSATAGRSVGVLGFLRQSWAHLRDVLPLFKPTGFLVLRSASVTATYAVATTIVARAGPAVTASHQICFQLWLACSLLADALAVAAQSLMARDLGAGSARGAREVAARVSVLSLGLGLALAVGMALAGHVLPGLFTHDPEVLALVKWMFPFIAAAQPITVLAMAWDGILYGAGGFKYAAMSMAIAAVPAMLVMQLCGSVYHRVFGSGAAATVAATATDATVDVLAQSGAMSAALSYGKEQLGLVWAGLMILMLLRWLTIAVPYTLRVGPFRKLREGARPGA